MKNKIFARFLKFHVGSDDKLYVNFPGLKVTNKHMQF